MTEENGKVSLSQMKKFPLKAPGKTIGRRNYGVSFWLIIVTFVPSLHIISEKASCSLMAKELLNITLNG